MAELKNNLTHIWGRFFSLPCYASPQKARLMTIAKPSQAAELIRTSFYMDDCLTGVDTVAEADSIRTSLNSLLSNAKMMLRKWQSSSDALLVTIPAELRETETKQHISSHIKTLGLHWDTGQDLLQVATPVLD